jgi:hypothetical protein
MPAKFPIHGEVSGGDGGAEGAGFCFVDPDYAGV